MFSTHVNECQEFLAGDHTRLRELVHPGKASLKVGYSLAHGYLDPGKRSLWHRLQSSEVYYFIGGQGVITVGERLVEVKAGAVVYVPPGTKQSLANTSTEMMEFLCLVDPAWRMEDEEVLE